VDATGVEPLAPLTVVLEGTPVLVTVTGRAQGDVGPAAVAEGISVLERRREAIVPGPWSVVRQVHGGRVVTVGPGETVRDVPADGIVSAWARARLAVLGADCPLVGLGSPEGVMGAVHAGWRGLAAGVLEAAVDAMAALGASEVVGLLGPCARPECYEFQGPELAGARERLGEEVVTRRADGSPALDLPLAVRRALERSGARLVADLGACTVCDGAWFSHRARRDAGRHALVVHREP
jgi:copper oxidase (laccase) domain-containing protein